MRNFLGVRGSFSVVGLMLLASPALASFHFMQIEQVIGGVNGDTSAQAIQLRMRSAGQSLLGPARIRAFDATGANPVVVVNFSANVPVSSAGSRVLVATPQFLANTTPAAVADVMIAAPIPASYLAAGSLTFETDAGTMVYWRLSWGGAGYSGPNTGMTTNDMDGNFGPPFPIALPSTSLQAVRFQFGATAFSTNNAADYALTPGAAVFTNNAGASFTVSAPVVGACCDFFIGSCEDGLLEAACTGDEQAWAEGLMCAELAPPCPVLGACCLSPTDVCLPLSEVGCQVMGGDYLGDGETCGPRSCGTPTIAIIGSDPQDGAIDARQPAALIGGCADTPGFDSIVLTFDGDATGLLADDFIVMTDPPGDEPEIESLLVEGLAAELTFAQRIPPRRWTVITHAPSGSSVRIGYLPGDVDNNRTAGPQDILRIIDHLNGIEDYAVYQTDVDRSGQTNPADILRVIDLLNGAGCYAPGFNGASLPP